MVTYHQFQSYHRHKSTGFVPWTYIENDFRAFDNDRILANTTSKSFKITLPANPLIGSEIVLSDYADTWKTNNLTIDRNGQLIQGMASDLLCDVYSSFKLKYTGHIGWQILTFQAPGPVGI